MSRAVLAAGLAALALLATATTGCDRPKEPKRYPSVAPRTTAPPGAVTEYTEDAPQERRSVRLTEGVAMALECRDSKGVPCFLDGSAVADDSVASYRRAYGDLDQTVAYGRRSTTQQAYLNRALFVVVARRAGNTTLTLQTGEGAVRIDVQVFASAK